MAVILTLASPRYSRPFSVNSAPKKPRQSGGAAAAPSVGKKRREHGRTGSVGRFPPVSVGVVLAPGAALPRSWNTPCEGGKRRSPRAVSSGPSRML
jgi:hypothetical protein